MRDFRRVWWWPPLPNMALCLEFGSGDDEEFARGMKERDWQCGVIEPKYGGMSAEEWAAMPKKSGYLDGAFAWQVVEHLVDPLGVCKEIRRVLRSDGYLVLSTPSTRSLECLLMGRKWDSATRPDHRHYFSPTSIRLLLYQAGFSRVTVLHQRVVKHVRGPRWFTLALGCLVAALHISSRITVVARP